MTKFAPNTYTYTKHLAEQVCIDYQKDFGLPLVIFRPSIVTASDMEPISGWCDNLNGPMGLVLVGALAISHVVNLDGRNKMDVVPVDLCVKGMIIASWKVWKDNAVDDIPIYNAASIKHVSYNSMCLDMRKMTREIISVNMFGIPSVTFTTCFWYAWIIRIFRNIIPALMVDGILKLTGNKPK